MTTLTIYNSERTKKAIINRTKLSDGYNYYITLFILCSMTNEFIINDNHKQFFSIKSLNDAVNYADNLIN
jgi:hypothetical protein